MQVVPAISPAPPSSALEETPCEHAGELDLETDLMVLESIVKKWQRKADVGDSERPQDMDRHMDRRISNRISNFSSRSFLAQSGLTDKSNELKRERTEAALVNALIELNNVACSSEKGLVGIAAPAVLYVVQKRLLSMSYGRWLSQKGWTGPVTAILTLAAVILMGSVHIAETVVVYEDQHKLTTYRRSSGAYTVILLVCLVLWFHIAQSVNRSMFFMLFRYFETIMILWCQLCSSAVYVYNLYQTVGRAGLYDPEWQVWNVLLILFAHMPGSAFIATMDALRLEHLWLKTGMVASGLVLHFLSWIRERFFGTCWSRRSLVMFGQEVGTTQQIFCTLEFQLCIFLSKQLICFLMGYPWCVIRADYLRPHHFSAAASSDDGLTAVVQRDLAACLQDRVHFATISTSTSQGDPQQLQVQTIDGDEL